MILLAPDSHPFPQPRDLRGAVVRNRKVGQPTAGQTSATSSQPPAVRFQRATLGIRAAKGNHWSHLRLTINRPFSAFCAKTPMFLVMFWSAPSRFRTAPSRFRSETEPFRSDAERFRARTSKPRTKTACFRQKQLSRDLKQAVSPPHQHRFSPKQDILGRNKVGRDHNQVSRDLNPQETKRG